jgi:hypothetical protein
MTKLSSVLGNIKGNVGEKTASAGSLVTPTATKTASDTAAVLKAALHEATTPAATTEKKAAVSAPIADLTKLAADAANSEHEALVKEAQLYGASVCDGFMARFSQYNEAAEKLASQQPAAAPDTRLLEKQAADLGFQSTMGQMDKLAGAAWSAGYNDTVKQIYTLAHHNFVEGYKHASELIVESRR